MFLLAHSLVSQGVSLDVVERTLDRDGDLKVHWNGTDLDISIHFDEGDGTEILLRDGSFKIN
jgi:hypothetical protein